MLTEARKEHERRRQSERRQKRRRDPAGFVYLVRSDGVCKIGRAADPGRRVAELQTAAASALGLVHAISTNDAAWLEGLLHQRFAARHVRGEWFALTDADLAMLADIAVWNKDAPPMRLTPAPDPFAAPPA